MNAPHVTPYPWIERTQRGALALTHRPAASVYPHVFKTFEHACSVFAFLIERGERVTPLDWCERIEQGYAPHHRRERVIQAIKVCMLDPSPVALFVVDGGEPICLDEFVRANASDPDACDWARRAAVGDKFPAFVDCRRIA